MFLFLRAASLAAMLVGALAAAPAMAAAPARLPAGTPEQAGVNPLPITLALARARSLTEDQPGTGHPLYSGEVTLLAHNGIVIAEDAAGYALRYADRRGDPLPAARQIPMRTDTIFDLASLSKLFTSIVAMQQVERGRLRLDAPVARYLPEFATPRKKAITVEELLTHTSGLPADLATPLWRYPTMAARIAAIRTVQPISAPGVTYRYSDMNMLVLQQILQTITGTTLDKLVRAGITGPLGMRETMYNPPTALRRRIAAEEYESGPGEPDRGLVWGQVHDESAWALGGVAGNAGMFGTVEDIAVLAQTLLDGGTYRGTRILRASSVTRMLSDQTDPRAGHPHGLGFELNQPQYMGWLAGPQTAGHTGFTGTTLVIDPRTDSIVLQFSNRVHPTRAWGSTDAARRTVCDGLAAGIALGP